MRKARDVIELTKEIREDYDSDKLKKVVDSFVRFLIGNPRIAISELEKLGDSGIDLSVTKGATKIPPGGSRAYNNLYNNLYYSIVDVIYNVLGRSRIVEQEVSLPPGWSIEEIPAKESGKKDLFRLIDPKSRRVGIYSTKQQAVNAAFSRVKRLGG